MKIFVAGATGVIGQRLVVLLVRAGHTVTGTTRSDAKGPLLESVGAAAAVVDVFDGESLADVVRTAAPDVIVHQLTDLPDVDDPLARNDVRQPNARLRRDGTRNLMMAARAPPMCRASLRRASPLPMRPDVRRMRKMTHLTPLARRRSPSKASWRWSPRC
jgi:nucleoside-diphosphate-sugar epimerase